MLHYDVFFHAVIAAHHGCIGLTVISSKVELSVKHAFGIPVARDSRMGDIRQRGMRACLFYDAGSEVDKYVYTTCYKTYLTVLYISRSSSKGFSFSRVKDPYIIL